MIYKNVKDKEYDFLKLTSIFSIGIPAIIALIASADFDRAFVLFHKIAFRNNYWIFDARTDPVINILPENFFMHCFIMIVCIVIILSIISYMIYRKKAKEILKGEIV
jgi:integral membrane protein (TIGR01906 family)